MTAFDPDRDLSDETLMAYADGALSDAEAAAVAAALEGDADAAQRLALFRDSRARLREAAAQDEVPAALRASVKAMIADHHAARAAPNVTPFPARDVPAGGGWRGAVPALLAASLALAVGLGAGLMLRGGADTSQGAPARLAMLPGAALAPLLDTVPSGAVAQTEDGDVTLIASFYDAAGRLCREVELTGRAAPPVVAVICRDDAAGWTGQVALRMEAGEGYVAAGGLEALDSYLGAIGAGPNLTPAQEADALELRMTP